MGPAEPDKGGAPEGVGSLVAEVLKAGAGPIFTLNGAHVWGIYLGAEQCGIPIYDLRDERTAAFAAEGWARLTRQPGVAVVTAGPGVANSVSALAAAAANESPLLLLAGRSPRSRWGMGSLQELDQVGLVRSLVKSAHTVERPEAAAALTRAALRAATSGRTGPVFLDIPVDVLFATAQPGPAGPPAPKLAACDPAQLAIARDLLEKAQRPILVAGSGVWWAGAEADLVMLAEAARLPVVLQGMGRGMLAAQHPLNASSVRTVGLSEADLLLLVGTRLDFRLNWGLPPLVSEGTPVVHLDVDDRYMRDPAVRLVGDVGASLRELAPTSPPAPRAQWLGRLGQAARREAAAVRPWVTSESVPIHPARLVAEVVKQVDASAILVGDGGDFVSFAGRLIQRSEPGLWIDGGPFGCLGSGMGYAIAAKVAYPDRQVVLLSGDGAFGFGAIEFDSLMKHHLGVVCVVANNGIWGTEKHPMLEFLGTSIATDLRGRTRYDLMAAALGAHGELVERPEGIGPAVRRALESGLPACVNVICDPEVAYPRSTVLL